MEVLPSDFKGGEDSVFGLDRDGVGVGKFSPKAKDGLAVASSKSQVNFKFQNRK